MQPKSTPSASTKRGRQSLRFLAAAAIASSHRLDVVAALHMVPGPVTHHSRIRGAAGVVRRRSAASPSLSPAPPPPPLPPLSSTRTKTASTPTSTLLGALPPPPTSEARRAFEGRPSTPGWASGQLDRLTDWVQTDEANRPVICEYRPDGRWLWSRWKGTVLSMCVTPVCLTMALGAAVDVAVRHALASSASAAAAETWSLLSAPPADDPLIQQLQGLNGLWEYQLTLCTLMLTFFTNASYTHWKNVYFTTRAIQGRINDICLLITIGAERGAERCIVKDGSMLGLGSWGPSLATVMAMASTSDSASAGGANGHGKGLNGHGAPASATSAGTATAWINGRRIQGVPSPVEGTVTECLTGYSDKAASLVKRCSRLIRLSHTFFWAAAPTCSNGVTDGHLATREEGGDEDDAEAEAVLSGRAIGPLLLSPRGLRRLVTEGELTANERAALLDSGLPPSQYAYILLEWVGLHVMNGIRDGSLRGDNGFEQNLLRQICKLRAEYFNIGDYAAGRMPLAYVQLMQVLVDCLVVLAPVALYHNLGSLSVPLTGLLTLFFKGLLELSKSFLDPFGNEGFEEQNIRVDVLVSETNFGAGSRWVMAGEILPSGTDVVDGVDGRNQ